MKDANESRSAQVCALCGGSFQWGSGDPVPTLCFDCATKSNADELCRAKIREEWVGLAQDAGRSGATVEYANATEHLDALKAEGRLFRSLDSEGAAVVLEGLELLAAMAEQAGGPLSREIYVELGPIRRMFEAAGPVSRMLAAAIAERTRRQAIAFSRIDYYRSCIRTANAEIERLRDRVVRTEKALATAESYRETLAGSIDDTFRIFTADVAEGPPR